jgi:hypothetical protein
MPFVSKAQRAWMHIHDPKMAKRWEKHTKKGVKLPYHVEKEEKDFYENVDEAEDFFGADDNQTKHLGFDVQEFNDDPIEEMPHLDFLKRVSWATSTASYFILNQTILSKR